jgi:soluble lytic murein transglycosylase-like protein
LCYYDEILTFMGGFMNNGPSLVIRGTFLGSLLLALLGWFLAGQLTLSPTADVAYAANESQTGENSSLSGNCQVSLSYPIEILQWCAVITEQATQNDLPANLLAALILQESGGDADAFSASGAVGLMQVMPRDGIAADFECINGPCFADRPTIEELQDPGFNVEYGSQMLSGLIATLGSQREALKAYGPMDMGYSYADRVLAIYERYR